MRKTTLTLIVTLVFLLAASLAQAETIKIGAAMPLTGPGAAYGEDGKKGAELAAEAINAAGGVDGKQLEIIYEDSGGMPRVAAAACTKLATVDKVPVIVGPLWSSETLACAPIVQRTKVVLLATLSSSPEISQAGEFVFRLVNPGTFYTAATSRFLTKVGVKRVGLLYEASDLGFYQEKDFKERFTKAGGTVVDSESFARGATDFKTQLVKVRAGNPEALFIIGSYREMATILRQMAELKMEMQLFTINTVKDPKFLELAGKSAEGIRYPSEVAGKAAPEFEARYMAKYNRPPGIVSRYYYDAVRVVADAVKRGGYTGEGIQKAMVGVKNFPGVEGDITFDVNGDAVKDVQIETIKEGKFVVTDLRYTWKDLAPEVGVEVR